MTASPGEKIPGTNHYVGEKLVAGKTTLTILGYRIGNTEELPVLLDVELRRKRIKERALEELSLDEALGLVDAHPDQVTLARSITIESLQELLQRVSTN